jgi:hypothetical protein
VASLPGIQRRLASVCDVKEIGEESYVRPSDLNLNRNPGPSLIPTPIPIPTRDQVRRSDAKLLEWLRRKTGALTRHLQASQPASSPWLG